MSPEAIQSVQPMQAQAHDEPEERVPERPMEPPQKPVSIRSRSRSRRTSQRLILAISLAMALIVLFVLIVVFSSKFAEMSQTITALETELSQERQSIAQIKPELARLQKELDNAVKGRLPHLRDLQLDKVMPINDQYVRNVVFTEVTHNGSTNYEYKIVLENRSNFRFKPDVRIFLFDKMGLQIGVVRVANGEYLDPGASRSSSGVIDKFIDANPRYFYLDIEKMPTEMIKEKAERQVSSIGLRRG